MPANLEEAQALSYEEGVPHPRDLAAMLRRRWKLIAGSALCGAPMLENLKASYDCIVIDSPSLLEATEARALFQLLTM
ncbi:hypothetical protein LJR235_004758 [Pararhizobium sp. LjRoot235]|uniref:hypothetical protein n=1 Tax=unclassified Pararhizobium TaxID=2643050 RepID=UPI003ECDD919